MDFDRLFEVFLKVMKVVAAVGLLVGFLVGLGAPGSFWSPATLAFAHTLKWGAAVSAGVAVADQFFLRSVEARSPAEWSPEPRPVPLAPAPQAADPSTPHPPEQSPEQTQKDKDSEQAPADSQNPTEAPAEKPSGDTPSNAVDADRPMARSHKTEVASSAAQPPGKDGSWSDRAGAAMDEAIEDLNS